MRRGPYANRRTSHRDVSTVDNLPMDATSSTPAQSMEGDSPRREGKANETIEGRSTASSEGSDVSSDATQRIAQTKEKARGGGR